MSNFDNQNITRIPLQLSQACVIASIQIDLTEEIHQQFRKDLLDFLKLTGATGVIFDVSGVEIMDLDDFNALRKTLSMVNVMGATSVISGLKPGVVASIIGLGAKTDDIQATLNLDEAFLLIQKIRLGNNQQS